MRKKYTDCQREDRNCALCSMVNYGRDCHNNPIGKVEWYRYSAKMTQAELAKAAGVNIRQIQKIEAGDIQTANLAAKTLFAIADALGMDAKSLL